MIHKQRLIDWLNSIDGDQIYIDNRSAFQALKSNVREAFDVDGIGDRSPADPDWLGRPRPYTGWVQHPGGGTMWVDTVEARSDKEAKFLCAAQAAADWDLKDPSEVRVVGLARGDVQFAFWEDDPDEWADRAGGDEKENQNQE